MKQSTISSILLLIISILLLFLLIIKSREKTKLRNECSKLEQINAIQADILVKLIDVFEKANIHKSKVLDCTIWNTETKEPTRLSSLLNNSFNVVIRLMDTGCSSCNQKQIEMLTSLCEYENLIILSNASNMRQLRLFLHENKIKSAVYWIEPTGQLFNEDDGTKILIMYVTHDASILKTYYLEEETLFLVKSII